MFDIYGRHFDYEGFDSSKYDLVIANMDTDRLRILQVERNINAIRSKKNNEFYIADITYAEEPLSFEAEIVTFDGQPIGESLLPEIERALFCRNSYGKLKPLESYETYPIYLYCIFTNAERIENDAGVIGYKFMVNTDSVMAWEEPTTETFTFANTTSGIKTFSVNVDTDLPDYTYPKVTFVMGTSGGNISLYNNTDDSTRITGFTSVPASSSFLMDSSINYLPVLYYTMFSNRNFIRLLNGKNNFAFTGNVVSITVTYQNRRLL